MTDSPTYWIVTEGHVGPVNVTDSEETAERWRRSGATVISVRAMGQESVGKTMTQLWEAANRKNGSNEGIAWSAGVRHALRALGHIEPQVEPSKTKEDWDEAVEAAHARERETLTDLGKSVTKGLRRIADKLEEMNAD